MNTEDQAIEALNTAIDAYWAGEQTESRPRDFGSYTVEYLASLGLTITPAHQISIVRDVDGIVIDSSTADQCLQGLNLAVMVLESLSKKPLSESSLGDHILPAIASLHAAIDRAALAEQPDGAGQS